MTLSNLVSRYLEWKAISASPHTLKAYRQELTKLVGLLGENVQPDAVDVQWVMTFRGHLSAAGLSNPSVARALAAVRDFVRWAHQEGIYRDNFASAVKSPRRLVTIPKAPTVDEMTQMLDGGIPTSWPERDRLIVELLYSAGLRNAELIGLNLDDRIADDEWLVRGKGRKERKVPMGECARTALAAYLPTREKVLKARRIATPALFIGLKGRLVERLTTRNVGRIVKQIAVAKGLSSDIHPHTLRHAFGTHLMDRGASSSDVKRLLGHAKLDTTMRYCGGVNWKRMRETYDRAFNR